MPVIYRVEHPRDGRGPYIDRTDPDLDAMEDSHSKRSRSTHPTPRRDGIDRADAHVCGFLTRRDAFVWFAGWRDVLAENGFRLARYYVPLPLVHVGRSGRQVLFDRRHAVRLSDERNVA